MSDVTANKEEEGEEEEEEDSDSIGSEIQKLIDSPNAGKTNKLKSKLKELENVTLNIAVTGMTGAGKSSFVNALRGLANDDGRAAPTGTTETTMKPNMYPHPFMPNVKIWDLPGIGSPKFRAKKYLKDVKFNTYDFFLIVTSERFKENDIELATAIQKSKKLFYFIRTKIDNDVRAESHKRNFDERMLLSNIREDCKSNLLKVGISKIFLVSSFQLEKFDFEKLIKTLEDELPENKRFALIQSLPVYSLENLEKKKAYFKKMIWLNAFASGLVAMPPLPGLSVACDFGIMKNFLRQVFTSYGLSNQALEVLSERVNKSVEDLKSAKTSRFKDGVTDDILIDMLSTPVIAMAKTLGTIMALLPLGALPAGGVAITTVHHLLNKGLNEMTEDTKKVLEASQLT
ncbi:interferon-inducible GTPase 5-like [Rhinichthys klamathensis goyatoka]|uniref:interferon-inducible GTPase 5-like n=1 Tax=Rhinichthys klamathensis goyatoka TaxID=3034132 RepID=UPI0024B5B077|nr:interferon-inducible GTPase 5-like [Rhinichthys klamathensis goyatoka]